MGLDLDTLGLGTLTGGFLFTLGGIDGVHRVLDLWARVDGGDQRLDHGEAETAHFGAHGLLHVERHIVLSGEGVVQGQSGDGGAQRILHVAPELTGRIAQLVVGGGHVVRVHAELGGGHDGHEHVVQRLGFQLHVELVDAHVGLHGDAVDERDTDMDTGKLDLKELAEAFDDVRLLLRNDEQCGAQQHDKND